MELVPDGDITAVASRSIERADAFAERHRIPTRHEGFEALAADPDVDVVYVATPHSRHEADTIAFLEAGKHVLCEKPFALNSAQARRMVDEARSRGLFLMEAMWSRFLPAYSMLTDIIGSGRIGEVQLVDADFGFRRQVDPQHRLFAPELGGGALLDLGVYPVQLCHLLLGAPTGISARGTIGTTGVDELTVALLEHDGGALGVVGASLSTPLGCTARISGTRGWVELPAMMHCPDSLTVGSDAGVETLQAGWEGDGLRFQVEHVQRCIAEGLTESPVMALDESVAIAATLDSVRASVGVVYPGE